jgi:hypothetical protein
MARRGVDEAAAGRLPIRAEPGDPPPADLVPANREPTDRGPLPHRLSAWTPGADDEAHLLQIGPVPADVALLADLGFAQLAAGGEVEVEVATALAVLLTDMPTRDAVLVQALAELDRPWLPMLISCATWTPGPLAPPLCSVLAMVAYRHGDGALAQLAVDRCLLAEPEHRLAHLMIGIMSAGMHPDELERIVTEEFDFDLPDPDWF